MQIRLYLHPITRGSACSRYGLSAFAGCLGINPFLIGGLHRYSAVIFIAAYAASGQYSLPIAVTSSSSKAREMLALVTWSDNTTLLSVATTPFDKNIAIGYTSFSVVVGSLVFVSLISLGKSWPILIKNAFSSSVSAIGQLQAVSTLIVISAVSKSPLATLNTLGADTALTLNTIELAASKLNTATIVFSMPVRLPSLSNIGTVIIILKFASGDIVARELLLGVMYGSAGATITLLANILLGG